MSTNKTSETSPLGRHLSAARAKRFLHEAAAHVRTATRHAKLAAPASGSQPSAFLAHEADMDALALLASQVADLAERWQQRTDESRPFD